MHCLKAHTEKKTKQTPNPLKTHYFSWEREEAKPYLTSNPWNCLLLHVMKVAWNWMRTKTDPFKHVHVSRRTLIKALGVSSSVQKLINKEDNGVLFLHLFVRSSGPWTLSPREGRQALGKQSLWSAKSTLLTKLNNFAFNFKGNKIKYWDKWNPWAP